MANKTTLTIDNESFDLLSYHNLFFYPSPLDKMFHDSEIFEEIENPLEIFGSMRKYHCWEHDLLAGYDHPSLHCNSYRPYSNLLGGVFTFTIESTGKEELFENCVRSRKDDRIPLLHGVLKFYNSTDEYIPFQQIEFWDGHVCHLSESFCSTDSKPMTMQVSISPATIRVNKSIVRQLCWWQRDIYAKGEGATDQTQELVISRIFWKGYKLGQERKDIMLNHSVDLEVEFSEGAQGDEVELTVKQSRGRRIKGKAKEFTFKGTIGEDMRMIIPDFKVECDFREDNQDFGMIEFYFKDNKVGELKENFGWTKMNIDGKTHLFANFEIARGSFIAKGCTLEEYLNAASESFNRTLLNSSNGQIGGKLFFVGTATNDPPQIVKSLYFGESHGGKEMGMQLLGSITVYNTETEYDNHLLDTAETATHELLHSLRLDHPFDLTQALDTELVYDEIEIEKPVQGKLKKVPTKVYFTTDNSDPNLLYNIMNYESTIINGTPLHKLWKYKRPEYLTKGQIDFILKAIDEQMGGYGTDGKSPIPRIPYWTKTPGDDLINKTK